MLFLHRENQFVIEQDIEAVESSCLELDIQAELVFDRFRQPGGCFLVRSGSAVPYHDTHTSVLINGIFLLSAVCTQDRR